MTLWKNIGTIDNPEPIVGGSEFGIDVDINDIGNIVIFGDPSWKSAPSNKPGKIYTFKYGKIGCVVKWFKYGSYIQGDTNNDKFGNSVSISATGGDIVGASLRNGQNGYIKVYRWSGTSWIQKGATIQRNGFFNIAGNSVDISGCGNYVSLCRSNWFSNTGFMEIWKWISPNWIWTGRIAGRAFNSDLGINYVNLSFAGTTVIVGGPKWSSNKGYIGVYDYNGSVWNLRGSYIDGLNNNDRFGWSVAISEDSNRIVVGAYTAGVSNNGNVYVYDWNGSAWLQVGTTIVGLNGDQCGYSVSIANNKNIIGIGFLLYDGPSANTGGTKMYIWDNISWTQYGATLSGGTTNDNFGIRSELAKQNLKLVVSAPGYNANTGKGYIYEYADLYKELNNLKQ